jgi:hypothetical protein
MIDRQVERSNNTEQWNPDAPVPAARPLSDFCMERVGDDVVIYDSEAIQYHTLNPMAYDVWRLCDGRRTVGMIAGEISVVHAETHREAVALAVEELGEAGLLEEEGERFDARVQRRAVLKLAAAGVIGALGLPLVSSVTAPDSASASSACPGCPGAAPCKPNGTDCGADCECNSGKCGNGGKCNG